MRHPCENSRQWTGTEYLFALFILLCIQASSQNLIENGGFDKVSHCPKRISQIRNATGWQSSGSPDLFCTCTPTRSAVYAGLSFVGSLSPYSGDCYAGFIVNPRYKEYITYELSEKMRRRRTYCLRFLYARSIYSGIKVDELGIYLHRQMYKGSVVGQPMHKYNVTVKIEDHPGMWTAVSVTFTCRGGERFLTLGSFKEDLQKAEYVPANKNPKNVRIFNYARSGYYFIENLELIKLRDGETCFTAELTLDTIAQVAVLPDVLIDTVHANMPFVLKHLNFETNKSDILRSSFDELDDLVDHLLDQPDIHLSIMGHTDNKGSEHLNFELSEGRAKAVADYLIKKGLARDRLRWKGFGSTCPIDDNNSESGRAKNRRVEFQFE